MSESKVLTFAEWYAQREPKRQEPEEHITTITISVGPIGQCPSALVPFAMQQAQRPSLSANEQMQQAQAQRGLSWQEREMLERQRYAANVWTPWSKS